MTSPRSTASASYPAIRLLALGAAMFLVMSACGSTPTDSAEDKAVTSSTTTQVDAAGTADSAPADAEPATTTSSAPDDTEPATTAVSTSTSTSLVIDEAGELNCAWSGDPVTSGGFPNYSGNDSILADARLAGHGTFDRFVLEFSGDAGAPTDSYVIGWTATPPAGEGSGEPVTPAGGWYLEIRAAASMYDFETETAYAGPTSLVAGDTDNVQQALSGGSFEGYMLWVIGADAPKGFRVLEPSNPSRIVVDVCVGGIDWEPAANELPCPNAAAMPAGAVLGTTIETDLDGDGVVEDTLTYFVPAEGKWHVRVETLSGAFDDQITDSDGVFEARPLGGLEMNGVGGDELFLRVSGGAATQTMGVYTLDDCDLIRTTLAGTPTPATWNEGATVANVVAIECHPIMGRITQHTAGIAGFTDEGDPVGWNTTHDVLELNGSVWSSQPGPPAQGYPGAAPPFAAELDCPLS